MKSTYFNVSGKQPDELSDIGARLQAVASEIYSLYCHSDFVLKQAFPQTATGEYLDCLANLRGVHRKHETKAFGKLTFFVDVPLPNDVVVYSGTICSVKDSPFVQFATLENCVIKAGELKQSVKAAAIGYGDEHNVEAGAINVIVNPISGVAGVTNEFAFAGGCTTEDDESLRKRLCDAYMHLPNGASLLAVADTILDVPDVLDCNAVPLDDHINVFVKTVSGIIPDDTEQAIKDRLGFANMVGMDVNVALAAEKAFDLKIFGDVAEEENICDSVIKAAQNACRSLRIGENLDLVKVIKAVSAVDGFELSNIVCAGSIELKLLCNCNEYLSLGSVSVNE